MTATPFLYCAAIALLLLPPAWRPWGRGGAIAGPVAGPSTGPIGSAICWVAGTFAAFYAMRDEWPPWPPTEAEQYWVYGTLLCLVPAVLEARAFALASVFGAGLFGAFVWLASEPLRNHAWESAELRYQLAGSAALGLATIVLRPRLRRASAGEATAATSAGFGNGPSAPGVLAISAGAAAAVLGQSYGGAAHMLGALGLIAAVLAILAMIRPAGSYATGLALVWAFSLPAILVAGVWFAETPWSSAAIVCLAPQVARIPLGAGTRPRLAAVTHGLMAAALGALALWLALRPENPYGDYYG